MAVTFPRYGKTTATDSLVSRNQMEERMTRDQKPRLKGFLLREVGYVDVPNQRATPNQFFLQGAPFVGTTRVRTSPDLQLASDETL